MPGAIAHGGQVREDIGIAIVVGMLSVLDSQNLPSSRAKAILQSTFPERKVVQVRGARVHFKLAAAKQLTAAEGRQHRCFD